VNEIKERQEIFMSFVDVLCPGLGKMIHPRNQYQNSDWDKCPEFSSPEIEVKSVLIFFEPADFIGKVKQLKSQCHGECKSDDKKQKTFEVEGLHIDVNEDKKSGQKQAWWIEKTGNA